MSTRCFSELQTKTLKYNYIVKIENEILEFVSPFTFIFPSITLIISDCSGLQIAETTGISCMAGALEKSTVSQSVLGEKHL